MAGFFTLHKRKLISLGIGLIAFLGLIVAGVFIVVQTDWFRGYVKQQIIAATEQSLGGHVAIGSFELDLKHLRVVIRNFVVHGKEPASAAPFLQAAQIQLDLQLFQRLSRPYDIAYLGVEKPSVN